MKHTLAKLGEILDRHVSGFHCYALGEPVHLTDVSRSFCEMTGFLREELLSEQTDLYARLIHPADAAVYADLLRRLKAGEQTAAARYRIICKNGTVRYVTDTISAACLEDGSLVGYSVLTDPADVEEDTDHLRFLADTCGFLKYTCEPQPRITYINDRMLRILRFSEARDGEADYLEMYRANIYLMIPMEERGRFTSFLRQVQPDSGPISGEITVLRSDGTRARLYGWAVRCKNEQGQEEFRSACMDITEKHQNQKASEIGRYLEALTEVYDKIFEYDFSAHTVKYVFGRRSNTFQNLHDIPMQLEEATAQWIHGSVAAEDRARVGEYFDRLIHQKLSADGNRTSPIRFRAASSDGTQREYLGIFLKVNGAIGLFCCRSVLDRQEADSLRSENTMLKNMQELVMRFTDGIIAFEVRDDWVRPLYANDNVRGFFGYTADEWTSMMQTGRPWRQFVSQSGVAFEDFEALLRDGEADFAYTDVHSGARHKIKAVCSQNTADSGVTRYIMLYNVGDTSTPDTAQENTGVYIRTFGYFDVFVNGKPIAFRNKKSKELFALLVDRRGGFISSEEAIGFLWEDEPANPVTLARYRKVALRLKNILEEYGVADIMESVDGKRRIVPERVRCDLYDYLTRKEEFSQLFKGSYLTNYSWAEVTQGELLNE